MKKIRLGIQAVTEVSRSSLRRSRRSEMFLLVVAGMAVAIGHATVFVARSRVVDASTLVWGVSFLGLFLVAHVAVRAAIPYADPVLLPATALLTGLGTVFIYRISPDYAARQTIWLIVGLMLFVFLIFFIKDPKVLDNYMYLFGVGSVFALLLTLSPLGETVRGARLWIGVGPVNIQPGEFAKVGIIVFLAAYLRENRELIAGGLDSSKTQFAKNAGPLLVFWGASMALFVVLNDFGTSLLFFGSFLALVHVATGRARYTLAGLFSFVAGALAVVRIAPHVSRRFDVWLDPWRDPQGSGYQIIQGIFALADGGFAGRGPGQAFVVTESGKTVIPDAHTDFIFAVIGNEMGMVGAVGVLALYMLFSWRGFAIARDASDGFLRLLAFGLTTTFALQTIIIIGGVVRMLPLTGQTLPFISYGGSSILANFIMLALLMTISHHSRKTALARLKVKGGATT